MPPEESTKTIKAEILEIVRILVIALLVVIPVRFFVAQPFIVRGASMEPSFHDGQYLVIDELGYRLFRLIKAHVASHPMNGIDVARTRLVTEVYYNDGTSHIRRQRHLKGLFFWSERLNTCITYEAQLVFRAENHLA